MNTQPQNVGRPRFTFIEAFLVLVLLFMIFRFTALLALVVLALLYLFFPFHHSRRALTVSLAIFIAALLIPVDLFIPGFHLSVSHSTHSGLRFVPVLYGLGAHRTDGGEYFSGGCIVGLHDTRWRLVWD